MQEPIQQEIEEIKKDIQRLGTKNAEGKYVVKFGVLFNDEKVVQYYEVFYIDIRGALASTLKAAKKQNILDFQESWFLKNIKDDYDIILK
ncbi:unnamed protein product [Paramecium pentaurelia]|uniref:Costars domain-containing protein n=1 Tax=Paramecium pentaurelia TaxID=43138 RepID=A0A8S1VW70_9CILI|nr:unnamed protein product [Paramecium pentaurelia]